MPYCDKSETSELQYLKKLSEVILVKCTQHYITCTDIWFHSSFKIDYRLCIYVLVSLSIRYSHALCTYRHSLCFFFGPSLRLSDCPVWRRTPSERTLSLVWCCWSPSSLLPATGFVRGRTSPWSSASSHSNNQRVKHKHSI